MMCRESCVKATMGKNLVVPSYLAGQRNRVRFRANRSGGAAVTALVYRRIVFIGVQDRLPHRGRVVGDLKT